MDTLKCIIRAKGKQQRALARQLNVSEPIMSRWANRTADIPARAIRPLADALGATVDEVLAVASITDADGLALVKREAA